ncbi:phytanoyl-CoA dioxygenase family protein [Sphingobium boeckii]|uniref:Ectoine hydroxylase-related dioxygenase (Phytanoyl-CoA dioxygenase family) n=1 Tax=Sphingobium boeckii TaxID=1082345 RepID=A0A7W9EFV1_9SPHN|nr:phytanoyl-CoA dioxygenase family protein [Sphingobium boeckii]MBB5686405.1 ectoine hydroxylase-related dioxygenase (phytanoyl-CoA dioxygenase family) [Sphingobium boeckii]
MNKAPLNPITPQHIEDYRRDGVLCLRQMFDAEWIESLREGAAAVVANPDEFGHTGPSHGSMTSVAHLWRKPGVFRDFALNSPVGEVVGRVIEADTIQMFHDHLFHKPPLSPQIMQWHADHVWPFTGSMVPNIWVALTPVNKQNGQIEFVAGYHHFCQETGSRFGPAGDGHFRFPDFEAERNNPDFPFKFVTWDLEPGDAVLFHVDIPHYSKGNDSDHLARSGLAIRVIGDDSYWCPREGLMPVPGIDLMTQPEGVHPAPSEHLPVIWSRPADEPRAFSPQRTAEKIDG